MNIALLFHCKHIPTAGIIAQDLEFIVEEGETEDVCVFVDTTSFTLTREVTITLTIENGTAESKYHSYMYSQFCH